MMNTLKLSSKEMDTILNKKSGLLGITGNNDLRTIIADKVSTNTKLLALRYITILLRTTATPPSYHRFPDRVGRQPCRHCSMCMI
jgi:acetate kinase